MISTRSVLASTVLFQTQLVYW